MRESFRRIGAFVIDQSVISMFLRIILFFLAPAVTLKFDNVFIDLLRIYLFLFVCVAVSVTYNVVCYRFFKYPLGKLLLRVEVVDNKDNRLQVKKYLIRECYKYTYIYATFGIYILYQFLTKVIKHKQTYHDKQVNSYTFV